MAAPPRISLHTTNYNTMPLTRPSPAAVLRRPPGPQRGDGGHGHPLHGRLLRGPEGVRGPRPPDHGPPEALQPRDRPGPRPEVDTRRDRPHVRPRHGLQRRLASDGGLVPRAAARARPRRAGLPPLPPRRPRRRRRLA